MPRCAYCKRLKRDDQLMPTHSGRMICIRCAEEYNMCDICGSTTKEDFHAHGQNHYEEDCLT